MSIPQQILDQVKEELSALDDMTVEVDGKLIKPSSCYYFGSEPVHILYNTNCPDVLKSQIENIVSKYLPPDESSSH